MTSFSLPSAGGVVSLLNDHDPPSESCQHSLPPFASHRSSISALESLSQHTSSTDSLIQSGSRSTPSTSPSTSIEPSFDLKPSPLYNKPSMANEFVCLPRIQVPDEPNVPLPAVLRSDAVPSSPKSVSTSSHVLPSSHWDRPVSYLNPSMNDHAKTSLSSSSDGPGSYDPSTNYPSPTTDTHDQADSNPTLSNGTSTITRRKEGSSGAITIGGRKRYPCQHPGCDKTFSTSGHAARHNRIHTGQKPYRCTFPDCKARFSRQDNSLQHYRTHILHPKGRGLSHSRDASSQLNVNKVDLDAINAEAEAKAELGRRALEDGTAIAVVHELKDQHGRKKGEAIERMVGIPRSRRESLRSNLIEDDRSTSPSSVDSTRIERQNSLPGPSTLDPGRYDGPNDFWPSHLARNHRYSLPQPHTTPEYRYRDHLVAPGSFPRDGFHASASPSSPWYLSSGASLLEERYPTSRSSVPSLKREALDPLSRTLPGPFESDNRTTDAFKSRASSFSLNPFGRPDDRSAYYNRYEADLNDQHRRSISMGSMSHERERIGLPSLSPLHGPGNSRLAAQHASSAPVSVVPSARSSQSPKSSPVSSAYSASEASGSQGSSTLDRLNNANGASCAGGSFSLSPSVSGLSSRTRLMGGGHAGSVAGPGYQHPYSSDRSTNFEASASRDTSPPLSINARGGETLPSVTRTVIGKEGVEIDFQRRPSQAMSSGLRTGLSQERISLSSINHPAEPLRRW